MSCSSSSFCTFSRSSSLRLRSSMLTLWKAAPAAGFGSLINKAAAGAPADTPAVRPFFLRVSAFCVTVALLYISCTRSTNSGELYLVIHAGTHTAAVNSYRLAISEELEPAKKAAFPFLWFFVVHKLSEIYMRSDRQQALEKRLPAIFLRFYDVFLIVTTARRAYIGHFHGFAPFPLAAAFSSFLKCSFVVTR